MLDARPAHSLSLSSTKHTEFTVVHSAFVKHLHPSVTEQLWSAQGSCSVQHGRGKPTCTKSSVCFPPQNELEGLGYVLQDASWEKQSKKMIRRMSLRLKPSVSVKKDKSSNPSSVSVFYVTQFKNQPRTFFLITLKERFVIFTALCCL